MEHRDHVNLLLRGIPNPGGVWADFGSGSGAFTLALAELIQPEGMIYSVDSDRAALRWQEKQMNIRFPDIHVAYLNEDYTHELKLPPLDGIVAANTLHFLRDKTPVLQHFFAYLKPSGRMILVEYNVDHGNHWVPYPFSYPVWAQMAERTGFVNTRLLATRSSHFLREIYSALSSKSYE
jgi:ubiquinone/menaquinone biosynthesis C-methylase UbiE